jgi:hypothetical protein
VSPRPKGKIKVHENINTDPELLFDLILPFRRKEIDKPDGSVRLLRISVIAL